MLIRGWQKVQHLLWVKRSLFLFFILLPANRVAKAQCADLWAQKREKRNTGLMAGQSAARGHSKSAVLHAACNIGNIALPPEFNKNIMSRWLMIQIISSASLMSKNQRAVWWLAETNRTVIRQRAHNTYFQPAQPPWQINLRVLVSIVEMERKIKACWRDTTWWIPALLLKVLRL